MWDIIQDVSTSYSHRAMQKRFMALLGDVERERGRERYSSGPLLKCDHVHPAAETEAQQTTDLSGIWVKGSREEEDKWKEVAQSRK